MYKERCKDCYYLFEDDNKEWCCDCYEKYCKNILSCPQVEEIEEVEFTIDNEDKV